MNPSGIGLGHRPDTEAAAAEPAAKATGLRGWLESNRRMVVMGAAGLVFVVGAGVSLLVLGGGPDPLPEDTGPAPAATGAAANPSGTPSSAGSATSTGTSSAVPSGSRNPFAPRPSASSTGTGSAGASSSASASATVTATITDPAVFLALFSIASDGEAKFSANGTTYTQSPGDTFGEGKALTYHKTVKVSGTTCASVSYVDQTFTVCPGEMHQVD